MATTQDHPPLGGPGYGPGPDPQRIATAHVTAGLLLSVYGAVVLGWVGHGAWTGSVPAGDFVQALVDPSVPVPPQYLGPYEWAFGVALLVVAALALARRPAARGGAVLAGWLLLALSLREGVGLFDETYRESFTAETIGQWTLATRVAGLLVAVTVLALMLPAHDRARGRQGEPQPRAYPLAGSLMILLGLANAGWLAHSTHQMWHMETFGHGRYLLAVLDPTVLAQRISYGASAVFYDAALIGALLVVGALLLVRTRPRPLCARGAALVLSGIVLYVTVRGLVGLGTAGEFSAYLDDTTGVLQVATLVFALATTVTALAITARDADRPGPLAGMYGPAAGGYGHRF